jgi:arylsulfatase A-like enzyme
MFTGRYPSSHDVRSNDLTFPVDGHCFPETLSRAGIRTQGIGADPWLTRQQGFHRGFDRFHNAARVTENLTGPGHHELSDAPALLKAGGKYAVERIRTRLADDRDTARFPLFLFQEWLGRADSFSFLNIPVAHAPYEPPRPFRDRLDVSLTSSHPYVESQSTHAVIAEETTPSESAWKDIRQLYTAGIAHADYLLSRALATLDDDTWVFLTADHGDHLGEYGLAGHKFSLSDHLVNVPLIVSHPSLDPGRRTDLVHHVDIAHTVYSLAQQSGWTIDDPPESLPGQSLLERSADERIVFSEYGPPGPHLNALLNNTESVPEETLAAVNRGIQAAMTETFKLVRYTDGTEKLYRRGEETADVSGEYPDIADRLRAAIDEDLGTPPEQELELIDEYVRDDIEDRLRELGYL